MALEKFRKLNASHDSGAFEMTITLIQPINGDEVRISIQDVNSGKTVFKEEYFYGFNASYNRRFASYYPNKPYIGDIIKQLKTEYQISDTDIQVVPGRNTFNGRQVSQRDVDDFVSEHIKTNSSKQLSPTPELTSKERAAILRCFEKAGVDVKDTYEDTIEVDGVTFTQFNVVSGNTNSLHLGYLLDHIHGLEESFDIGCENEENEYGFYAKTYSFYHYPEDLESSKSKTNASRLNASRMTDLKDRLLKNVGSAVASEALYINLGDGSWMFATHNPDSGYVATTTDGSWLDFDDEDEIFDYVAKTWS